VSIVAGTAVGVVLLGSGSTISFPWSWILAASGAVAFLGWRDDKVSLPVAVRLLVELTAAFVVIAAAGYVREVVLPAGRLLELGVLGLPLTILWIVGFTNIFNFMDGIDGLAASQGLVAALGWILICGVEPLTSASVVGTALSAACLGFLFHNWAPARIFMGDVGSLFIGFLLAVLPVGVGGGAPPGGFLPGLLLVWPFVFDGGFTLIRRLLRGENVTSPHRSHLYQRLVISGLSHGAVASLYTGLSLVGLGSAVALVRGWNTASPLIFGAIPVAGMILLILVFIRERGQVGGAGG
jgi:UDP-N-acetylmuramyl pentapeptide phosphotransferase/UDP-N-acetylglucosamine-1-phosphate transferase